MWAQKVEFGTIFGKSSLCNLVEIGIGGVTLGDHGFDLGDGLIGVIYNYRHTMVHLCVQTSHTQGTL